MILTLILILLIVILLIILGFFIFDMRLQKVYYTLQTPKAKKRTRICLITDLHNCSYGKNMCNLISAIDAESPDIILLSGDIFDDKLINNNAKNLIDNISSRYPTYMALGNHEFRCVYFNDMLEWIDKSGTKLLRGEFLDYEDFRIFGIDDPEPDEKLFDQKLKDFKKLLSNEKYNILIAHYPSEYEKYKKLGVDLVVSGHMHGGQWRFPGINGLYVPRDGLFPKYAGGLYRGSTDMVVSRGLCRERIKCPRILNRPELVFIDIVLQRPV